MADTTAAVEDVEKSAGQIFAEGKLVLVELSTDPDIVEVDESLIEEPKSMMRSLSYRVGFSRFGGAAPAPDLDMTPIDEEAEVQETEEDRLLRERIKEENRKLEKIKRDIRRKEIELLRVYETGKNRTREYKQTENAHKRDKNSLGRSLWMKQKSHNMAGIKDYKNHMFKVSLPCHDASNSTLTLEAKLLKADHGCRMLEHQMKLLHEHQQPLINFLHKGVMAVAHKDREESTFRLKDQVMAAIKKKDALQEAYEDFLTAQRKFIGHLQLHVVDDESDTASVDSAKEEAVQLAKGTYKDFKSTKLRRSAELRIEAKFGTLLERQAKKEVRQEVFQKTLQNVEEIERTSLERAKNVSGEIESVLSSLQIHMASEEMSEHPDEDKEEEEPEPAAENPSVDNANIGSMPPQSLHSSFVAEEEEEVSERHEDEEDHIEPLSNDSSTHNSVSDDHSQSSARRRVEQKDKQEISARLEKLRAKRRQQEEEAAKMSSSRKLGSGQSSSRRDELLERARSARSSRLVDSKIPNGTATLLSPRTKEAKLAELRERRKNRAGAASAIPPATVAEGS